MEIPHKDKPFWESKKALYFMITLGAVAGLGGILSYLGVYNVHLITTLAFVGCSAGGFQGAVDSVKSWAAKVKS